MDKRKKNFSNPNKSQNLCQILTREQTQTLEREDKNRGYRELPSNCIRAMEGEGNERKFIISFSSEEPYQRWFGKEILDHEESSVDLTRLNSIGVLLFNHDRDKVIGKINRAWIENKRGQAEIEFDTDEFSEMIYQKVKNGTLKTTSVGYSVDEWDDVMPGKKSANGKYEGPCSVAIRWEPFEASIVSVPADKTVGVGRAQEENTGNNCLAFWERQLQINKNLL